MSADDTPTHTSPDIFVIGAGISGLSFAWQAARAGRQVVVLEASDRIGGCIYSRRFEDGYWFELGAHTVYNSYTGLLEMVQGAKIAGKLVLRGPARARFGLLRGDALDLLTPPKVLGRLSWLEAAVHAPLGIFRSKRGRTLSEYLGGLLGEKNFKTVLSPFLAAVPSQNADGFPAQGPGSLFKKRPRNKAFPRSFGFHGGLQTVCDGIVAHPNIRVRTGVPVEALHHQGSGVALRLQTGETLTASQVALAVPPSEAARLVEAAFPNLAAALGRIDTVAVESMGIRLPKDRSPLPSCAFVVPADDIFFSAVTRDPFPDEASRGFAFHFRPNIPKEEKIRRMAAVLQVAPEDLSPPTENRITLPAPARDHAARTAEIQAALEATPLALTGNYFAGLAIEDCIARSIAEWRRISSPTAG